MRRSAAVERWFETITPPSERAMRRVRDIILSAHPSMTERVQYGVTFSSSRSGDFAAFVRYRDPGVNLRLHRGGRLTGTYPHLVGGAAKRMLIADVDEANARAAELRTMVREWCALGEAARVAKKPPTKTKRSANARR